MNKLLILLFCSVGFAGAPETRIKIAIIDSGLYPYQEIRPILCKDSHQDFSGTTIEDQHGHGTNIATIVAHDLDPTKVCLVILKYTTPEKSPVNQMDSYLAALSAAVNNPSIQYINISSGGNDPFQEEKRLIQKAIDNKKYIILAAGNNNTNLSKTCNYYPPCYKFKSEYFRVAGSGESLEKKSDYSNYGGPVTDWVIADKVCAGRTRFRDEICMSGTSQATAGLTNRLVKKNLEKPGPSCSIDKKKRGPKCLPKKPK